MRRVRLLSKVLRELAALEIPLRRHYPIDALCAASGVRFVGFEALPADPQPMPRALVDTLWAVDWALRFWPLARDRKCLRRALIIGSFTRDLHPVLSLEVAQLEPLELHAVLTARGQRLDLGRFDEAPAR